MSKGSRQRGVDTNHNSEEKLEKKWDEIFSPPKKNYGWVPPALPDDKKTKKD